MRPRLSDAQFFWHQDAKRPLHSLVNKLKTVTFQKELGTLYDKTLRVKEISLWLAQELEFNQKAIERAALLSRCDLMTEMVYEFPELQ